MKVSLIASTVVNSSILETDFATQGSRSADTLAEFAGRSCYQSWSNPSGRDNAEYLGNILSQGHYSVLEHASATFYVEGVSRSLTHELVRHRHLSYSQLSQRFVDESSRAPYVIPPAFAGSSSEGRLEALAAYVDHIATDAYKEAAHILEREGKTRKQAREAARAFLPNMTETKIVVSGNHRAWRDFLGKRHSEHADAEIKEFARLVLRDLRSLAPASYQDIPDEPFA